MRSYSLEVTLAISFDLRHGEPIRRAVALRSFDLCLSEPFTRVTFAFRTTRMTIKTNVVILDHGEKRNDILQT